MSNATNNQLIWIASISLLVGGIGVMNIMLVSVTERTSEIGLKKALGAKRRRILWQFLTEAAVLTCMGGLLGVLTGVGLAELISRFNSIPVAISIPAIAHFRGVFHLDRRDFWPSACREGGQPQPHRSASQRLTIYIHRSGLILPDQPAACVFIQWPRRKISLREKITCKPGAAII